jgi:hypothetical protein
MRPRCSAPKHGEGRVQGGGGDREGEGGGHLARQGKGDGGKGGRRGAAKHQVSLNQRDGHWVRFDGCYSTVTVGFQ